MVCLLFCITEVHHCVAFKLIRKRPATSEHEILEAYALRRITKKRLKEQKQREFKKKIKCKTHHDEPNGMGLL